jgi:hypothetical protein
MFMACEFIVSNLTVAGAPALAHGAQPVVGVLGARGDVGWGGAGVVCNFCMASNSF